MESNPVITTYEAQSPARSNGGAAEDDPKAEFHSDEEGEDMEAEDEAAIKPWDEGGPSDCGYSDTLHSTLMTVGETVHKVVGAPGKELGHVQQSIGNWFQELSYAARDIMRGENTDGMHQDAADAVKTLMSGGKTKDEQDDEANDMLEQSKENQMSSPAASADV